MPLRTSRQRRTRNSQNSKSSSPPRSQNRRSTSSASRTRRFSSSPPLPTRATYLYESLLQWARRELGIHIALVCGGGDTRTTFGETAFNQILTNFSPRSKHRNKIPTMPQDGEIDLLIATDCIQRRPEPAGLRLPRQLRYPLEPSSYHSALRPHRPNRQRQRRFS